MLFSLQVAGRGLLGMLGLVLLLLTAMGACAQSRHLIFVEGFRASDSLSREAAAALRAELPRHIMSDSVHIMSTAEIQAHLAVGTPDDFGQPWSWQDVREVGRLYRATTIIDIAAHRLPTGIRIEATRLRTNTRDSRAAVPAAQASTLKEAITLLAKELATDTVLRERK